MLDDLQRKTGTLIGQHRDLVKGSARVHYALYSRSGFTPDLRARAEFGDILLIEAADL